MSSKEGLHIPVQAVFGRLHLNEKGRAALELLPGGDESGQVFLRYGLTEMGTEKTLFPALLLDDWGNELTGLRIYHWVYTKGEYFPRAELFGYDNQWNEAQWFVRILELDARHPCFAYSSLEKPQSDGVRLTAVFLPDSSATEPEKVQRPFEIRTIPPLVPVPYPFEHARVTWWRIPQHAISTFSF